jgi:L-proline amide hydrolase
MIITLSICLGAIFFGSCHGDAARGVTTAGGTLTGCRCISVAGRESFSYRRNIVGAALLGALGTQLAICRLLSAERADRVRPGFKPGRAEPGRGAANVTDNVTDSATIEGFAKFGEWRTWYRITGALDQPKPPLVVLHGGPGLTHEYVDSFKLLGKDGRAVIHYDQIGNGRSSHLRDRGPEFWTVTLFLAELDNLLGDLGIAGSYHLLGQSWGGMLAAEHAVRRPPGLRALVLADSPASMALWVAEANRLRANLPAEAQATLLKHEAEGTTNSHEYQAAAKLFYDRHVCRVVPNPPDVESIAIALADDPTVYHTMNGPTEFHVVGTLKHWSIIDRLDRITAPTLLVSGRHDEATEATVRPYADRIPDVRWTIFEHSSHMPHVEETALCMRVVGAFLAAHDRAE